jgi:signal transduction histidine kinase
VKEKQQLFLKYWLFCLLFTFSLKLSAQIGKQLIDIQKIDVEGEFLNHNVFCMLEDSRGFLWFGTDHGICRYDGSNIKTFTIDNSNLTESIVHELIEDSEGLIWSIRYEENRYKTGVKSIELINIYTLDVKSFTAKFGSNLKLDDKVAYKISQGDKKEIYVFNSDSEISYLHKNGTIVQEDTTQRRKFLNDPVFNGTVDELAIESCKIRQYSKRNYAIKVKDTIVNSQFLHTDSEGNHILYHSTSSKSVFYPSQNNFKENWTDSFIKVTPNGKILPLSVKNTSKIQEKILYPVLERAYYDRYSQRYWYHYKREIGYFREKDSLVFEIKEIVPDFKFEQIYQIDFTPNLTWVCTSAGVYSINIKNNLFDIYMDKGLQRLEKNSYSFRAIYTEDNDEITCGTNDSMFYLKSKKITKREIGSSLSLLPDGKGNLIAYQWGLTKINQHEKINYPVTESILSWSMARDNKDTYWIGTIEGLFYWREGEKNTLRYSTPEELDESNIFYVHILDNENLLLATDTGIYEFSPKSGLIKRYWTEGEGSYYLPHDEYYHIYEDTDGKFWLSSNGFGLVEWNKETGKAKQYSTNHGLSSDIICATYEDDFNNLWLSSYYGLMRMDKESKSVRVYTKKDGLPGYEFNRTSHFKAPDGKLYFGGINGFISFYPEELIDADNYDDSPLELTSISHFDIQKDSLIDKSELFIKNKSIRLRPGEGFLNISFALLDYQTKDVITYAYQIEGQSDRWYYTKDNNLLINGLPYGDYTIRVKGQMNNGKFSKYKLEIPLEVIRPIYLTWWFLLLTIGAITVGVIGFFKWRTRQLFKQQKKLERLVLEQTQQLQKDKTIIEQQAASLRELDKSKSRFFANVSHELRTPITLIKGPIEDIINSNKLDNKNLNLLQIARRNVGNLLSLVDEILDLTRLESSKLVLDEKNEIFYILIRRIISNFQSIASIKNIQLTFNYEPNSDLQIKIDSDKFEKIFNNLLSNALKFTPKNGHIRINVKDKANHLLVLVQDNGRGISAADLPFIFNRYYQSSTNHKAEGGLGIGLSLSMDFVKLLEGELWVESKTQGENKGTTFFLKLPKKEVLSMLTTDDKLSINKIAKTSINSENVSVRPENAQKKHSTTASNHSKEKILLVEDNHDLRKYIETLLLPNYKICMKENGEEAMNG